MLEPWLIAIIVVVSFIVFILILLELSIEIVMRRLFNHRGDGCLRIIYPLPSEYPNLNKKSISIKTSKGNILYGFEYTDKNIQNYKAVILLVHGIGSGHFYFLELINAFAKAGYIVVCYDQSGSMISTGSRICEMSQALPDICHAYHYIDKVYHDYDIFVAGHSWGGYAALNSLNIPHNRIKKVLAIAGFNSHKDIALGTDKWFKLVTPGLYLYDIIHHGKYAFWSGVRGLKKSKCPVMCVHAENDKMVPLEHSYIRYSKVADKKDNIKITFYEGRAHTPFLLKECEEYCSKHTDGLGLLGEVEPANDYELDFRKHYRIDDTVVSTFIEFFNK